MPQNCALQVNGRTRTPFPVINWLNGEIVKILRSADAKERLTALGRDPVGGTPEEYITSRKSSRNTPKS